MLGASGFIGRSLVQEAAAAGHEIIAPSRETWRLGAPLPAVCEHADVVVHLASATLVARRDTAEAAALDLRGSKILLDQTRTWRRAGWTSRFVFVSSQSARTEAKTNYGRSKYAIETLLDQDDEVIVRPGLAYDESGSSVFGLFEKLSRLPVLPVFSRTRCIQPIAVQELAVCLLRIAGTAMPARYYNLGAERPLSMAEAVEAAARRAGRRPPLGIRVPATPVRWTAVVVDRMLRISPPLLERIDGLIALQPMETAASLASLDMRLAAFDALHVRPVT